VTTIGKHAFVAVLVCAGACGGALHESPPDGARGGSGGRGGSANGGTEGIAAGGAGAAGIGVNTTTWTGAGGQGGDQACNSGVVAACACDSQAAECQSTLMTACLGPHCPPSFDDAMLVANWPVDSASTPGPGRTQAYYYECTDGRREFTFRDGPTFFAFAFDASGRLAYYVASEGGSCPHLACGDDRETLNAPACTVCGMISDPRPEGTRLIPRGTINGPPFACEVDANGRWSTPHLAPAN